MTPDKIYGLPVWCNDPRWSILGYALEPSSAAVEASARRRERRREGDSADGRAETNRELFMLDWVEDLLQVQAFGLTLNLDVTHPRRRGHGGVLDTSSSPQ